MCQWRKLPQKLFLGVSLTDQGYKSGLVPEKKGVYVKVPVFSFAKLRSVDITLGPEMKSTGEVMGKDITLEKALYKGLSRIRDENSKIWDSLVYSCR